LLIEELRCYACEKEITAYFNENYKGNRGKCLNCKTDFPLE
jgi:hypothetical protein